MQNIKNIIFDYGNVIFEIDFEKVKESFRALGIPDVNNFFSLNRQSVLFDAFDMGQISAAQFRDEIRTLAKNSKLTDHEIDAAWNSLLTGVPEENHIVLKRLKNRYRTFLLSNNNELHYAYILNYLKANHGVKDNSIFFEKDYYSHLLGMRKPNKDIFEYVLSTHGLIPEETLFIDDSTQHLMTAKSLGIRTQIMRAPDTLVDFIRRSGLDISK